MYAAGGNKDWKDTLDAAVEKFRAAGCPEPDIQAALRNHTEADQLDLPPVKVCPVSPRCLYFAAQLMTETYKMQDLSQKLQYR